MEAPTVVYVTQPLNVTCLVMFERTPMNDIQMVKLFKDSTEVMTNSALSGPFRADLCQRYSAHGHYNTMVVSFTLSVQAAFNRDGGEYTCKVYERTGLRTLERTWSRRIRVIGDYAGEGCFSTSTSDPADETQMGEAAKNSTRSEKRKLTTDEMILRMMITQEKQLATMERSNDIALDSNSLLQQPIDIQE